MGTDIHWYTEAPDGNGVWQHVDEYKYRWIDRNYILFATLAGVRNGYGFAGVDWGNPVTPIAEPRGLPDDVSRGVQKELEEWTDDDNGWSDPDQFFGHTPSYLKAAELLGHDWNQEITLRGLADSASYTIFKETGRPGQVSGDVYGPSIRHVTNIGMERILGEKPHLARYPKEEEEKVYKRPPRDKDGVCYYTKIQWKQPLAECVSEFVEDTLPALGELAEERGDARVVFWFDS